MKHLCTLALALSLQALSPTSWAQSAPTVVSVADKEFETHISLHGQTLLLNGAGTSSIMSARATAVGLYLPSKTGDVERALAMPGAKRVMVVALRDLSARDLSNALLDRIRQNAAPGEVEANVLGIAAVGGAFGSRKRMAKGEVLTIDYLPASKTTEFRLNGQAMSEPIPGDKLFPMLMKVWIGPKVRAGTRDSLMGVASASN